MVEPDRMASSSTSRRANDMYGSGVASLIGGSGISLDGQSIQLPDDGTYDVQDDVSSINESSCYRGVEGPPQIKILGPAERMEEGHGDDLLTPASMALSPVDISDKPSRTKEQKNNSATIPLEGDLKKSPPNMGNTSKLSVDGKPSAGKKGCFPGWVYGAPRWLKFVIVFSTAMLIGAVVLVTVALSTALANKEGTLSPATKDSTTPNWGSPPGGSSSVGVELPSSATIFPQPDFSETEEPTEAFLLGKRTVAPTSAPQSSLEVETEESSTGTQAETTLEPTTNAPEQTEQTDAPVQTEGEANDDEIAVPEETDASQWQVQGTEPPAQSTQGTSSMGYDPYVTTFFVTGGRFTNEALSQVPDQLKTLPVRGETSFLVHLGDWNSPYATRCDEQSYQDVNDLFTNSSIPTYFIPGDNDFNDCPDPPQAMTFWHQYLLDYETQHWDAPSQWTINRASAEGYPENFAFVYNEILFVGINLVGGVVHDSNEWITRQAADLKWIEDNYQQYQSSIKAFILFAHADPDVPSNSPFYEPFKERVKEEYNKIPVVLIHRNLGVETWNWETDFENIKNFSVVVAAGSVWPPLMGAVDFRQENPFIFDQTKWYDEFMLHQSGSKRV